MTADHPIDPRVSVVIPGHLTARWPQLVAAVRSVQAQSPRPARIVLAVDHNDALLARVQAELPEVTAVANALPAGASGNRNTGVAHTDTPLIALLDDDAVARPGWLAGLLRALDDEDVLGAGGAIVPAWATSRPAWFPDELLWAVTATPASACAETTVRNVWSASMIVRRTAFDAAGGFRVGFAPRGDGTGLEDTDLCLRIGRAVAGRWIFVPDAIVDHAVPVQRTTVRYLLARCYREGRGKVTLAHLLGGHGVLDLERRYLRESVVHALGRHLANGLRGHGFASIGRAGALLVGLTAAAFGGLAGLVRLRPAPPVDLDVPAPLEPPVGVPE